MWHWGFLGTARINFKSIALIQASGDHRLYAVASRDAEKAASYAREHGFEKSFPSYEALLKDPRVDLVYNSLPNHLHLEWTLAAIRHGKHVLCEKPIALRASDVDLIAREAATHRVQVSEGFMYRHHPRTRRATELLVSGKIGRLLKMNASFHFPLQDANSTRWAPEMGGGSLWDVGCYPVHMMRFLAGADPESVVASAQNSERGVDVFFSGQLRFPGNVVGAFDCGFVSPRMEHLELIGTEGIMRLPKPFRTLHPFDPRVENPIELEFLDGRREVIQVPNPESPYFTQMRDLVRAIETQGSPLVTLRDSRANVATIEALYAAAKSGAVQKLATI